MLHETQLEGGARPKTLIGLPSSLFRCLLSSRGFTTEDVEPARRFANEVDWPSLAHVIDASGVGPIVLTRMRELGLEGLLADDMTRAWEADRLHAELQCSLQRHDAVRLTEYLTQCGIRHAFIKGFVLREWLYSPTWVRGSSDTDVLIDRQDAEATRDAIRNLGFVQAARSDDFREFRPATPAEISATESSHYELAQFARVIRLKNPPSWVFGPDFRRQAPSALEMTNDGPVMNSVVDVHWALHFLFADDRPLESVMMVEGSDGEFQIPTLSAEWQVFFTAFKLYFEAFDRPGWGLHMLADLAALVRHGAATMDWEWLEMQAVQKDMEAMLFYTLSAADQLLSNDIVPRDVLDRLSVADMDRRKEELSSLDFGDFMSYVARRRAPSRVFSRP